jgi:hypothetical protein
MKQFEEQKFNINELTGISKTNIEEHLKLYSGYVKHANLILEKISSLSENIADNGFLITSSIDSPSNIRYTICAILKISIIGNCSRRTLVPGNDKE